MKQNSINRIWDDSFKKVGKSDKTWEERGNTINLELAKNRGETYIQLLSWIAVLKVGILLLFLKGSPGIHNPSRGIKKCSSYHLDSVSALNTYLSFPETTWSN